MPYISKESKDKFQKALQNLPTFENSGELNYFISSVLNMHIVAKGLNYENINNVVGVLSCVKSEFYHRVATPYEIQKMKENGDIYSVEIAPT